VTSACGLGASSLDGLLTARRVGSLSRFRRSQQNAEGLLLDFHFEKARADVLGIQAAEPI
jgi:hypothetical protein